MQTKNRKQSARAYLLTLLTLLLPALAACASLPDPETRQDFNAHTVATVNAAHTAGQTFISRRPRLNGIDIWLAPAEPGLLKIELFHNPEDATPLFSEQVLAPEGQAHIRIPPLDAPPNQPYYLKLSALSGEIGILGRSEDAYAHGTAFLDDHPLNADLAFRVTYDYDGRAARSDLERLLTLWDIWLPLGLLLLLPGYLLLDLTTLKLRFDFGERVALSLGISLALIPLLMQWTTALGLRWASVSVWGALTVLLIATLWRQFRRKSNPKSETESEISRHHNAVVAVILLAIFTLALFIRFAMVRDLAAPAWVDSIHHGLITRLILENGGHPGSFAPFIPTGADHYHFGSHSGLAAFVWLTGLELHTAMLIYGQALNALMVFPIYLLAKMFTRSRAASLTAALITAAFTLMPAYYASWGRYTQLAGLLILPAAFVLAVSGQPSALRRQWSSISGQVSASLSTRRNLLAALTLAGLFLVHYRVTAFWGALILAYLLTQVSPRRWLHTLGILAIIGAVSALLLMPWLPKTVTNLLIPTGKVVSGGGVQFSGIPWNFLKPGLGIPALWMAGIGLALGLLLRRRFPVTLLLWTAFLYLMANLGVFANLPGAGFINPVSMEITLFMPIAILGGFAVGGGLEIFDRALTFAARWCQPDCQLRLQESARVLLVILGAAAGILGAQRLLPTLNPVTFLAREADFPAIRWIDENLPAGESILINPAAWGYGFYMGNDGGFWISALTAHPTMPPPVLYGMGTDDEIRHVNGVVEAVQTAGSDPEALWGIMESEGIGYVYLGARGGVISAQALDESSRFSLRYHEAGTWVFERLR